MKIAGASLNQTPIDWESNTINIIDAIGLAKNENVDLLCLPELCIPSYGCQDLFLAPWVQKKSLEVLFEIIPHTLDLAISVGLPIYFNGKLYNCTAFVENGKLQGFYVKQILANEGVHYENRWFYPWPSGSVFDIEINGNNYPIGDIQFEYLDKKIGFEICEDAWHEDERPANNFKVDIILNPSASHFAFDKAAFREDLIISSSKKFDCTYVYVNLLGNESGRMIFDGDVLIAEKGKLYAKSNRLGFKDVNLICNSNSSIAKSSFEKNEEFIKLQSLALFDYLRKSKSQGFVLSLSGGADSSSIAIFVSEMINRAVGELGIEGFKKKLSHINPIQTCDSIKALKAELLTCVYQRTRNSSKETLQSAEELARELGSEFHNWSVEPGVERVTNVIESAIGRELSWDKDDLALQNIQARIRAPYIWMLANIKNSLLLATSNRSESAMGYATMDGDTSGSISPLSGIDKQFIRQWLVWAEKELNYSALKYVNDLQPSAELRPLSQTQTDEEDLMPYDVLNRIENLAIRDRKSRIEIEIILEKEIGEKAKIYIDKFFTLWQRNQWKRERYAASFHVDEYSLDPKSWARFPILSGKY